MYLRKNITIFLLLYSFGGFSQTTKNELTGGININTRSSFIAGIHAKYSKRVSKSMYQGFGAEIVNVKHPKELRVPSAKTANTFVLGKNNYLFSVRPNVNIEKVLFEKDPSEGVRVNILAAAGPSVAILKPYIIEYEQQNGSVVKQQFNPDIHDFIFINGNAGILSNFGDSRYVVGGHLKASLLFEYSTVRNKLSSIEAGFMYEQLTKTVELNPFVSSESSFFTAFVNISIGKKL